MDLFSVISHLVGPGTIKNGLKVINHVVGDGRFDGPIEELQKFTDSPAWTKHRYDNFKETWDDHQDDIDDFIDNVGDTLSGVGDKIVENVEVVADTIGSILGDIF